jgi:hypothetical protein
MPLTTLILLRRDALRSFGMPKISAHKGNKYPSNAKNRPQKNCVVCKNKKKSLYFALYYAILGPCGGAKID